MKIGFIVGKDDEIYDDDYLYNMTPKKYLKYGELNTEKKPTFSNNFYHPFASYNSTKKS